MSYFDRWCRKDDASQPATGRGDVRNGDIAQLLPEQKSHPSFQDKRRKNRVSDSAMRNLGGRG